MDGGQRNGKAQDIDQGQDCGTFEATGDVQDQGRQGSGQVRGERETDDGEKEEIDRLARQASIALGLDFERARSDIYNVIRMYSEPKPVTLTEHDHLIPDYLRSIPVDPYAERHRLDTVWPGVRLIERREMPEGCIAIIGGDGLTLIWPWSIAEQRSYPEHDIAGTIDLAKFREAAERAYEKFRKQGVITWKPY